MERFVIKARNRSDYIPKCLCRQDKYRKVVEEYECSDHCNKQFDCASCELQAVFNRLGAYEKTGLSPEQVQNLIDHVRYSTSLDKSEINRLLNEPEKKKEGKS